MYILSFLGTGNYQESTYKYKENTFKTCYFAEACNKFFNPEKIFIVLTKEAKEKHYDKIKERINCELIEIEVPYGKTQDELMEIFEKIADKIPESCELVFDITHGFRSQPMIVLSVAVYLRLIKSIKIYDILYGAFEAKDENNCSPVFSLIPFLDFIDWTNAADFFIKRNDSTFLRDILKKIHSKTHIEDYNHKAEYLAKVGETLKRITNSFSLIRTNEICKEISLLNNQINEIKNDLENISSSRPFARILEKILLKYQSMCLNNDDLFSNQGMNIQKEIIKFYLNTNQFQQAITLLREYFISIFCLKESKDPQNSDDREDIKNELGKEIEVLKNGGDNFRYSRNIAELWCQITDIRNDIDHAGIRPNPIPSTSAIEQINKVCNKVFELNI